MEMIWGDSATLNRQDTELEPHDFFVQATSDRVPRVAAALSADGSCVVLIGELGSGKSFVAQAAVTSLAQSLKSPVERIVIEKFADLDDPMMGIDSQNARHESERISAALAKRYGSTNLVIIAMNIDKYSSYDAAVLEHLVRIGDLRFVCTAQELTGAADRLARNPDVEQFGIAPLSFTEASEMVAGLLGVSQVTEETLNRWHAATRGNAHALVTLALGAERRGAVRRADQVAWVEPQDDIPSPEFVTHLGDLSPTEYANLELVSYAKTIMEPQLLRLLDSESVTSLIERQILAVQTDSRGNSVLTTRLPVTGDAVRARISPVRRTQLASLCFEALNSVDLSTTLINTGRSRLVRFGLESGEPVPADWAWQAMHETLHSADLRFSLTLALAAIQHEDPQRAAEATLRACEIAHFLGDRNSLRTATEVLMHLLNSETKLARVTASTRLELQLTAAYLNAMNRGDIAGALSQLDEAEQRARESGCDVTYVVRAHRMRLHAMNGNLRFAFEARGSRAISQNLETEMLSLPARIFEAVTLVQRGSFKKALDIASTARELSLLHGIPATASGGLECFAMFLSHWARGTTGAAKRVLSSLPKERPDLISARAQSGTIDLAVSLVSIQDGRWSEAATLTERTLRELESNDPFGLTELAQAMLALSRAVLGDTEGAREALSNSERQAPGLSLALGGFVQIITLRTHHWLRDTSLVERAFKVAAWARDEDLALIELEALDIAAHELSKPEPALLQRAEMLSTHIDSPIGEALLAHIRTLTRCEEGANDSGIEPEERLLSELGVWLPLPPTSQLTGREREIALFTSLGYSSKHVAERLHLSARTIETHLAHVYGKLGLNGREALREWFSTQRERLT
ncbi:LuxR family transcriptional regulator [Leucobacter denitrificans]|uniref:HTH luxR-type domain-containing protein n=1 Tax=Leucobacter denitrificans TaxID=683042 RepID=A0A7G9S3Y1_9MICO|nr:LuxR family transcriptional regulator [Leucobacter denitrificans]QNN62556.1 hypothetical protein H9L06_09950 [Leucobacter denitrificans]